MARTWQSSEIGYLKRYAGTKTLEALAQRFDTDIAEVTAKLRELGLTPKDGWAESDSAPSVETYEEALQALHAKRWSEALGLFEQVVEAGDPLDLAARARQFIEVCRDHMQKKKDGDDPYLQAVVLKNRGELAQAMKIAGGAGTKDERFVYLTASIHALEGDLDKAEKTLRRAIELNPRNRVYAYHDRDFAALHDKEKYADLFGLS